MKKRFFSLLTAILMLLAVIPTAALAQMREEASEPEVYEPHEGELVDGEYLIGVTVNDRVFLILSDDSESQAASYYMNSVEAVVTDDLLIGVANEAYTFDSAKWNVSVNEDGSLSIENLNGSVLGVGEYTPILGFESACVNNSWNYDGSALSAATASHGSRYITYVDSISLFTYTLENVLYAPTNAENAASVTFYSLYVPPEEDPEYQGTLVDGFYFETREDVEAWTMVDSDGDGINWCWSKDRPLGFLSGLFAYEGRAYLMSYSHVNLVGCYDPDNWAISPAVELPEGTNTLTFHTAIANRYYRDHFAVYVGTSMDIDEMTEVLGETEPETNSRRWGDYEVDLSDFSGETVYIAFRHFNSFDRYQLWLDAVEIWNDSSEQPEPTVLWGDANGDGEVTLDDALLMTRFALNIEAIDEQNLALCDVNGDGEYTMLDALLIMRRVMNVISAFPVELE